MAYATMMALAVIESMAWFSCRISSDMSSTSCQSSAPQCALSTALNVVVSGVSPRDFMSVYTSLALPGSPAVAHAAMTVL